MLGFTLAKMVVWVFYRASTSTMRFSGELRECPLPDSNRNGDSSPRDFKSLASTNSAKWAPKSAGKVSELFATSPTQRDYSIDPNPSSHIHIN